ncbi:Uma2 family endonuclease [Thiocapsa sp.]|uniref:Uma2 family endonuclease n=1 Tax=Thiocapsa sp. TaxID=2024551 RepID=UPI00345A4998
MEAHKPATVAELLACPDERVELIGGEIVRRPMARGEHAMVQGATHDELSPFQRKDGPGGWWIATEISVAYVAQECPSHDLAGWRKEPSPKRPRGVVELTPDWVCEIVSPGHERKDTLTLFLPLQRHRVPFYWLIWPESRTLDRLPARRRARPRHRHHYRAHSRARPPVRCLRDGPELRLRRIAAASKSTGSPFMDPPPAGWGA